MIPPQHILALETIHDHLRKIESAWAVTGSFSFALQGLELEVNERVFTEKIIRRVEFSRSDKIASHWGELNIDGVKVEIMGALQKKLPNGTWESPVDVKRHREFISFEGISLPVLSLAYEEQAYRTLGRIETADRVKEWLNLGRWLHALEVNSDYPLFTMFTCLPKPSPPARNSLHPKHTLVGQPANHLVYSGQPRVAVP